MGGLGIWNSRVPVVVGALGVASKRLDAWLEKLGVRGTQRICSSLYLFPRGILLAGKNTGVPMSWLGNLLLIEVLAGNY